MVPRISHPATPGPEDPHESVRKRHRHAQLYEPIVGRIRGEVDTVMAPNTSRPRYVPILALPYWGTIGPFVESAVAECMQVGERRERDLFAAATPMVL